MALISFMAPAVFAGKVEVVRAALKKECKKSVSDEEALAYVRALYLTCIPETNVRIANACQVKCLKSVSATAAGR